MTSSHIDIQVNCNGSQRKELYQKFSISFEFHHEKLKKINQSLAQICGIGKTPFLIFQLPTMDFKGVKIQTFQQQIFEHKQIAKNNKLYHYGTLKSLQTQKFIKSLEKSFKKLTQLSNFCKLQLSFYDIQNLNSNQRLWDKALIKGEAQIDKQFIRIFKQLVQKVSPQFINSPIIIFLQLLQSIDISMNVQNMDKIFPTQLIRELIKVCNFQEIKTSEKDPFISLLCETKQQLTIMVTVGNLASIKIKGPARTLGKFIQWIS